MHIYLHIGIGKTGTSSIQSTLYHNRKELLKSGILYPETGLQNLGYGVAHFGLCPIGQDSIDSGLLPVYQSLQDEIESTQPTSVVISTENFAYAGKGFTRDIGQFFQGNEVSIVLYVREQVALIESTFLWWQKAGWNYEGTLESFYQIHNPSFNYLNRVEPWASSFGEESLICRVYDKRLIGENVVNDFFSVINTVQPDNQQFERENPSLPACFSSIVSLFDRLRPDEVTRNEYIDQILKISSSIPKKDHGTLISPQLRESIRESYRQSNLDFAARYLEEYPASIFLE